MSETPHRAPQRTAPGRHVCCFPQNPPRSGHAVPPQSLSLGELRGPDMNAYARAKSELVEETLARALQDTSHAA